MNEQSTRNQFYVGEAFFGAAFNAAETSGSGVLIALAKEPYVLGAMLAPFIDNERKKGTLIKIVLLKDLPQLIAKSDASNLSWANSPTETATFQRPLLVVSGVSSGDAEHFEIIRRFLEGGASIKYKTIISIQADPSVKSAVEWSSLLPGCVWWAPLHAPLTSDKGEIKDKSFDQSEAAHDLSRTVSSLSPKKRYLSEFVSEKRDHQVASRKRPAILAGLLLMHRKPIAIGLILVGAMIFFIANPIPKTSDFQGSDLSASVGQSGKGPTPIKINAWESNQGAEQPRDHCLASDTSQKSCKTNLVVLENNTTKTSYLQFGKFKSLENANALRLELEHKGVVTEIISREELEESGDRYFLVVTEPSELREVKSRQITIRKMGIESILKENQ